MTVKDIGDKLAIGKRTLQTYLKNEGVTFRQIRTGARKELARIYLSETDYTIEEIAYLLGFSEGCVFRRAFKNWTGMTPSHFRSSSECASRQ